MRVPFFYVSLIVILLFHSACTVSRTRPANSESNSAGLGHQRGQTQPTTLPWTIMIYAGVDSTAEPYLMPHLQTVIESSRGGVIANVLLLIDRTEGSGNDSKVLGANFNDTRLFRLEEGRWQRVSGGREYPEITLDSLHEANTGDAQTLRKFIRVAKSDYPAGHYALVIFGHGECRSVCPDTSSVDANSGEPEDSLFVGEISEGLTAAEAVDVMWIDVCSFGSIENAYQYRPDSNRFHTKIMLATPPLSAPAPFVQVLERTGAIGDTRIRGPIPLDARSFGLAALSAIEDRLLQRERNGGVVHYECWGCYDLAHVEAVKRAVDRMAEAIDQTDGRYVVEEIRGYVNSKRTMHYAYIGHPRQWIISPHFDLYDLASRIREDERLSRAVREAARDVLTTTDSLVIQSVGMSRYKGFQRGKNGIFIIFPGVVTRDYEGPVWESFGWYHPFDRRTHRKEFGLLDWCRDGATEGNERVENWFELMDKWFDEGEAIGGANAYRY